MSHMMDCELFGLKAGWHHAMNLLFHAVNTLLVFLVLRRMTGATWRSVFVAALFGLHPLQVGTVAWVAERKNVLSTFFLLLTLWEYVRFAETRNERSKGGIKNYLLMVIFFTLGLMCKPMLVTLPCVMLLLDFWPLKRMPAIRKIFPGKFTQDTRKLVWLIVEKIPLLILAAASSVITVLSHERLRMVVTREQFPLVSRLAHAAVSYATYLKKAVWPNDLAVCICTRSIGPRQRLQQV